MTKIRVLFCDLDGTLIETINGETFPKGIWDMKLKFDVLDAIKNLAPEYICVISNQGGIEKGFVNEQTFQFKLLYIESCMQEYLGMDIYHIRHIKYCSSNDKDNKFRKPNIGMCNDFLDEMKHDREMFSLPEMLMIGDASGKEGQFSDTDKKTAENFKIGYMDVEDFVKEYGRE